ncbi:MAG: FmdB family zinc ribbon protein, partial [Micromonosporaceae bacterium]
MPTYQYACTACSQELEAVQSFSDDPLTECPECSGRLRKVFSAVGVVFKGSGFYRNDSRAGNGSSSDNGSSDGNAKNGAKSSENEKSSGAAKSESTSSGGSESGGAKGSS